MTEQRFADRSLTYRVNGDRTAWREVDGQGVVLDLDSSVYFGLNRAAGALWPRLLAGCTYTQLIEVLLATSPPPPSRRQAAAEVSLFLAALDAEKLLTTASFR